MGIFRRNKRPAPVVPSTGHPGDDQLLALIARDVGLDAVQDWTHYVYFAREETARAAARRWVVIGGREVDGIDPEAVRDARAYFERLAATRPRSEYDGWEVSGEAAA